MEREGLMLQMLGSSRSQVWMNMQSQLREATLTGQMPTRLKG